MDYALTDDITTDSKIDRILMLKNKPVYNISQDFVIDQKLLPGIMQKLACTETFNKWQSERFHSNTNSNARRLFGSAFRQRDRADDWSFALSLSDCYWIKPFVRFYSVAQHSINCANEAKAHGLSARVQIASLFHDASEAYLSDITHPVKSHLAKYLETEKQLQNVIYNKFLGSLLSEEEAAYVKQIDRDMLVCEFDVLMRKRVFIDYPIMSSKPSFGLCDFSEIEHKFLNFFDSAEVCVL
jgi:hypothetical protein